MDKVNGGISTRSSEKRTLGPEPRSFHALQNINPRWRGCGCLVACKGQVSPKTSSPMWCFSLVYIAIARVVNTPVPPLPEKTQRRKARMNEKPDESTLPRPFDARPSDGGRGNVVEATHGNGIQVKMVHSTIRSGTCIL